jgi:DNA-binding NarL/FixJ family response regulator
VLIVCTDLIFSTKITGTAKAVGKAFGSARNLERLQHLLDDAPDGALVIVDLNAQGVDPLAAIALVKSAPRRLRVVAFLSHVQAELAAAARQAGADEVLARSAFSERLPAILTGGTSSSGRTPD